MILYEWVYNRGEIAEGLFCSGNCAENMYIDNPRTRYKGCASPLDEQESEELAADYEVCSGCGKSFEELKEASETLKKLTTWAMIGHLARKKQE